MPDDLSRRQPEDSKRINVEEDWELNYWSQKLGCTKDRLKEVVKKVGPMVNDVRIELNK